LDFGLRPFHRSRSSHRASKILDVIFDHLQLAFGRHRADRNIFGIAGTLLELACLIDN
jgi:hypothetical protein